MKAIANDVIENQEKINHHGKRADAIVKGMLQHSQSSTGLKQPTDINDWRMNIFGWLIMGYGQRTNHSTQR